MEFYGTDMNSRQKNDYFFQAHLTTGFSISTEKASKLQRLLSAGMVTIQ